MRLAVVACLAASLAVAACKSEPPVTVVWEDDDTPKAGVPERPSEEELRQEHEKKLAERENAPEPELDPEEPREKYELVWRMGGERLRSIYNERAEMIAMLQRVRIEDEAQQKVVDAWIPKLTEFGIGREAASMEQAPAELCRIVVEARDAAMPLIDSGSKELERIQAVTAELDELQDAGGTVYQKTWDKLEEERKRWSKPVTAGKQMLLVVKSILEEAYVLADLGPRRAQLALRDCLTPIAAQGIALDLAQEQLEKVVTRSRWYRELR